MPKPDHLSLALNPGVATPASTHFRAQVGSFVQWRNHANMPCFIDVFRVSSGELESGLFVLEVRCSIQLSYGRSGAWPYRRLTLGRSESTTPSTTPGAIGRSYAEDYHTEETVKRLSSILASGWTMGQEVRGKLQYFGVLQDADSAFQRYIDAKDDVLAG